MKNKLIALVMAGILTLSSVPAFAAAASIKKTEYEGNGVVEVDFKKDVQYKNAKIVVKDSDGRTYTAKITDRESDGMEIYVKGLKKGKKYTVQISGVRLKGTSSYGKVSKTFTAG